MDKFLRELETGEINQRDDWQFELKSEFLPQLASGKNTYIQEFYLFIPNALQIHEDNYLKSHFYQDQTNFIRYKTPPFTLKELADKENKKSPLYRLEKMIGHKPSAQAAATIEYELKLFGNILRSSLRERIRLIINRMNLEKTNGAAEWLQEAANELFTDLKAIRTQYFTLESEYAKKWEAEFPTTAFLYVDEFLSNTITYYFIGFLDHLKKTLNKIPEDLKEKIRTILSEENKRKKQVAPEEGKEDAIYQEHILYRSNLLNKYVLDALLLNTARTSVNSRFSSLISSVAAGIAMLFFFVLFVQQGTVFLINSSPFIILTVLLYVLKDRIKEGLKAIFYEQFPKWFSDYRTTIKTPDKNIAIGRLEEYFSYLEEQELPPEITAIRNRGFHTILEDYKRPEQVLYCKKKISLYGSKAFTHARRFGLNIIFRFNIHRFLKNADNPTHGYISIDPETLNFFRTELPKVYHINIILKNQSYKADGKSKAEFKKFRLILDKNGIKRIEHFENILP